MYLYFMEATSRTKNTGTETKIDTDTGLPIDLLRKEIERGVLSGPSEMDMETLKEHIKREARRQLK